MHDDDDDGDSDDILSLLSNAFEMFEIAYVDVRYIVIYYDLNTCRVVGINGRIYCGFTPRTFFI